MTCHPLSLRAMLLGVSLSLMGCMGPSWALEPSDRPVDYEAAGSPDHVFIAGTMDRVQLHTSPLTNVAISVSAYRPDYFELNLDNYQEDWRAMLRFNLEEPLDDSALTPGTELPVDYTVGCSGAWLGIWDFDDHANFARLRVDAGSSPRTRNIRLYAVFGTQTVEGAFEIFVR